jgi:hypothetical protein
LFPPKSLDLPLQAFGQEDVACATSLGDLRRKPNADTMRSFREVNIPNIEPDELGEI